MRIFMCVCVRACIRVKETYAASQETTVVRKGQGELDAGAAETSVEAIRGSSWSWRWYWRSLDFQKLSPNRRVHVSSAIVEEISVDACVKVFLRQLVSLASYTEPAQDVGELSTCLEGHFSKEGIFKTLTYILYIKIL